MEKMLFKEWAEEWLVHKKAYVKESTYANYSVAMKNQIIPAIGEEAVEDIGSVRVQSLVSVWIEHGRVDGRGGLSIKTIKDLVSVLKMCIRDYAKYQGIKLSPLDINFPVSKKLNCLDILSKSQQQKLLDEIQKNMGYEELGYALSLYTGMRIGEICALQWGDIDMETRCITVNKTLQRIYMKELRKDAKIKGKTKIIITTPKSAKSVRKIPISDALYKLLARKTVSDREWYLLTGSLKYMEPRLYRKHYQKFLNEHQIDYIRFHGLRHTFATRCIEKGADHKVVSELMGHSSVNLTLSLYVHPQWEEKKRCVELIE